MRSSGLPIAAAPQPALMPGEARVVSGPADSAALAERIATTPDSEQETPIKRCRKET
jgi:hypothetical protein